MTRNYDYNGDPMGEFGAALLQVEKLQNDLKNAYAEIERLRRVELDHNDGLTLVALRELLARKTTPELVGTLRDLAMDYRLDLMPAKFRCVMQEAANRLKTPMTLTDAERDDLALWVATCFQQCSNATEGGDEEAAERWNARAVRVAKLMERLGGQ